MLHTTYAGRRQRLRGLVMEADGLGERHFGHELHKRVHLDLGRLR